MPNLCLPSDTRDDISNALVQIPTTWTREQLVTFVAQDLASSYDEYTSEELIAELIHTVINLTDRLSEPDHA